MNEEEESEKENSIFIRKEKEEKLKLQLTRVRVDFLNEHFSFNLIFQPPTFPPLLLLPSSCWLNNVKQVKCTSARSTLILQNYCILYHFWKATFHKSWLLIYCKITAVKNDETRRKCCWKYPETLYWKKPHVQLTQDGISHRSLSKIVSKYSWYTVYLEKWFWDEILY